MLEGKAETRFSVHCTVVDGSIFPMLVHATIEPSVQYAESSIQEPDKLQWWSRQGRHPEVAVTTVSPEDMEIFTR